ncbi:hypothetical protein RB196_32675 [Streptomyces sp. PmtA]|uniref:hypothetical protein n=1 Tax=Streptomyces sp. PmtA TaxID=3074275 RepID=UPI003014E4DF
MKDPHGNVMSFYYGKETNYYTQNLKYTENGKPYVRGGYLKRAEYGQRDGQAYTTAAPARVVFTTDERCVDAPADCEPGDLTDATAGRWPDVPWDRNCVANTKCEGKNCPHLLDPSEARLGDHTDPLRLQLLRRGPLEADACLHRQR